MLLSNLKRSKWYNKKAKRVGRGNASGKGNYSTRWIKGQLARSGGGMPAWFEWGQTPLTQRLPKYRGFKRYYKLVKTYIPVNLERLEKDGRIQNNTKITKELLKQLGYIKKVNCLVKILGKGDLTKKLEFEGIDAFSKSAMEKIKNAGWNIK